MKNINKLDLLSELMRDSSESISTEDFNKILTKYNLSLRDNDAPSENEKQFNDSRISNLEQSLTTVYDGPNTGKDKSPISIPRSDYDGTCTRDVNGNTVAYDDELEGSNSFGKITEDHNKIPSFGDSVRNTSIEYVDYAKGMRVTQDFVDERIERGYIRDPKYGEVLRGKITYAEYAKSNQIIILKQRMKMLADRLVWYKGGVDNHVLNKYRPVYFSDLVNYYQLHLDCNNKEVFEPFWERAIDIVNIVPVSSEIMKSSNLTLEQKSIYTIINFLFHRGKRLEEVFFSIVRSQFKPNTLIRPDEELFNLLRSPKDKPTSFMELTLDSRLMPLEFIKYLHLVIDICSHMVITSNNSEMFYKLKDFIDHYLKGKFSSMTLRELINPDYPKFKFSDLILKKIHSLCYVLNHREIESTPEWKDLVGRRVDSINLCINTLGPSVNFVTNLELGVNNSIFSFEERFEEWQKIVGIR